MTTYIIRLILFFLLLVMSFTGMAQEESNDQYTTPAEQPTEQSNYVAVAQVKKTVSGAVPYLDRRLISTQRMLASTVKKE
jgi:hypothetical protein